MIGKLKGRIDEADEESVIIDVNGVGYQVFCSARTLALMPKGTAAELMIETHVREDHIHLYGFPSAYEREWFKLLTTVQGVGAKMGLAILGAFSPDQLAHAIAAQDKASLNRISGVGPKLAERLITELKNKVAKMAPSVMPMPATGSGKKKGAASILASVSDEAVSALVNLGYTRSDAFAAVASALREHGDHARLDQVITYGLKELAR